MISQTIIALASGQTPAGVAVLRLSGSESLEALRQITALDVKALNPRQTYFTPFVHPDTGHTLDKGLALYFKAPHSFTGEDVVELHIHGGRAVIDRVLDAVLTLPSVRLAEPGEFTKRAYLNDKMDLTEAEALNDLIHAETQAQADLALAQMSGSLRNLYEGWATALKNTLAYIEADIDFSDEELPESLADKMRPQIETLFTQMMAHLNDSHTGERLRDGIYVAVLGVPNAGKSSLINTLAKRDVAIVSPTAGTTRDLIEVHLNLDGLPVILVDTAGIHNAQDAIENEGIKRAIKKAQDSDLKLILFPSNEPADREMMKMVDDQALVVVSKNDLSDTHDVSFDITNKKIFSLSTQTSDGIHTLLKAMSDQLKAVYQKPRSSPLLTRKRHRESIEECTRYLQRALDAPELELMAEDIRLSIRALGRLTGRVDVEDLLDVIFKDFCIGK